MTSREGGDEAWPPAGRIVIAMSLREQGATGVQTHVGVTRRYLARAGVPVRVVTPFQNPRGLVLPTVGSRRVLDLLSPDAGVAWYRRGHGLLLRRRLRQVLAEEVNRAGGKPVVVYAQDPVTAGAALAVRPGDAVRVAMAAHYNISQADEWADKGAIPMGGRTFRGIRAFEHRVIPRLDGIVYVSNDVRGHTESRIPEAIRLPAVVVPNFLAAADAVAAAPPAGPVADLVTVGSLEPRKNQAFLLDVLGEAAALGIRPTLTVIGDGPDRASLQRRAVAAGVAGQVRFMGSRPSAARLLPGYRLYVHAARMESFGMVLIEAMASGLPILAAPVGGIPEVFRDGIEGRFWLLDDPAGAAGILAGMLADPAGLAAMGRAARARFIDAFEAERGGRDLLTFLLGGQP